MIISVPSPQPRPNEKGEEVTFEKLPEAIAETKAVIEVLQDIDDVKVKVLAGKDANYKAVYQAVKENYQIIHFNGHAFFNEENPRLSSLVLDDRNFSTGPIVSLFGESAPTLCFVNACQTGKISAWQQGHDVFGLGRALLETGCYFLGSPWPLSDVAASKFAQVFYELLIKKGKSMGESIQGARIACKESTPADDFGWASYTFYGDPRSVFAGRHRNPC